MATLTYDPANDPTALAEIEAEEQEALALGEQMEQQQQELLAGKFRDAEELESAYINLQRKLGERPTAEEESAEEDAEEVDDDEEEEEEESDSIAFLNRLSEEAQAGEFSDELLEQLDGMSSRDVADMFLEFAEQQDSQPSQEANQMTDEDINHMYQMVGGQEQYQMMAQWAQQSLSEQEVEAFDQVVDQGDPLAVYFAVQALAYRYMAAEGFEGEMLTGKAASNVGDVFRSTAELVRAMDDPRYDDDPAYRRDVEAKLERSNLEF